MPGSVLLKLGAAAAAMSVVASGCSSSQPGTSGAAGAPTLVVYSAQGYDAPVTEAFSKASGIQVKLVDDSTGPLLTKIAAEANNPQWSVLWVDGDTAFAALDKQGKLKPYTASAQFTSVGQALVPENHAYVPVSATVVAALIYNAAKVDHVPASYDDLLRPEYAGKVGMNDPSQSGPTFPLIAGLMNQMGGQSNGVAAGEGYLSKLKANGLHVYPTNGDTLHALETGQISYGLVQSSAAAGELAKAPKTAEFEAKVVYLPTSTLLPAAIGIDTAAPREVQDAATKFIDFVLSPAGQSAMQDGDPTGDSLYWPIVSGVNARAELPTFPAAYQKIDPYYWGPLQDQVTTFFTQNIK